MRNFIAATAAAALMASGAAANAATLDKAVFGMTKDGRTVDVYTMTNDHGLQVKFLSYGGDHH